MKAKLIFLAVALFLFATTFGQSVTLRWYNKSKPGIQYQDTWDATYGFGKIRDYKAAVKINGEIYEGSDALAMLHQPSWGDGVEFADILPLPTPYPEKWLVIGGIRPYPAERPTADEMYFCFNAQGVKYTLDLSSEKIGVWTMLQIIAFQSSTETETRIINPEWLIVDDLRKQEKQQFQEVLSANLTLMGNYSFRVVPDTPEWIWLEKQGRRWVEIPVEAGKYNQAYRWVEVPNGATNDKWRQWATVYFGNADKEYVMKSLLGL